MRVRNTFYRSPEGDAGTAGAGGPPPANDVAAFLSSVAPEVRGVVETKGWHKEAKTPAEVLSRAIGSYTEAEKALGGDRMALPPKDAQGNRDWSKADWNALGRPEKPEGYSAFAPPQGGKLTDEQVALRDAVHAAGLSNWQVQKVAGVLAKLSADREAKSEAEIGAETTAAQEALQQKWGAAHDTNVALANRAMSKASSRLQEKITKSGLGRDPEFMEMFAEFGKHYAEDATANGLAANAGVAGALLTPAQALVEIGRINADSAQMAILQDKGHVEFAALKEKYDRLFQMAYPESKA